MGVGNLQQALMAYGKGIVPYAQLYFDSSPLRHAAAWRKLAVAGRRLLDLPVAGARRREIMRLYRTDPKALEHEAVLQSHKASAEEVLHPPERTPIFGDPFAIGRARASGDCARSTRRSSRPTGCGSTRAWARSPARQAVAAPVPRAAPAGARVLGDRRGDADDLAHRAADGHEHGARQGLPASWPRPTRRPPPPTRCTPPATPSTSPATTAAVPRRWPSSSSSTASRRGA